MSTVASSIPVAAVLLVLAIGAPTQARCEPNEAREITYNEAHDLLTAFLKVAPLAVEQSGDVGYKEFYFFMADMGTSCRPDGLCVGDLRYYAVDRRTVDVWSSVICRQIATPALTRLQAGLHKRIGLTKAQYEGLKRPGPLCEPGMPRGQRP
jgi:hypothetical protein